MDALKSIGAKAPSGGSTLPPELASGLPREAAAIWETFDRLAATAPEEYKRLTSRLLAEAAASAPAGGGAPRGFTPTPGFCVCVRVRALLPPVLSAPGGGGARPPRLPRPPWLAAGAPVFVNACTHERVEAPRTEGGAPAPDAARALSLQELLCLNIPLVVAPLRRAAAGGAAPGAAAVDVLTHPWVQGAATREPAFRRELTAFLLAAVADEFCVEWEPGWSEAAGGARYKGGAPDDGAPVPYEPPRATQSVADALGVGAGARQGGGGAAGAGGKGAPAAGGGKDDIFAAVRTAAASGGGGSGGGSRTAPASASAALGGLSGLLSVGLSLAEAAPAGAPAAAAAAPPPGAAAAAGLADFAAKEFPASVLLYDEAVASSSVAVGAGGGSVTATIAFDPSRVATKATGFLGAVELELGGDSVTVRLPPALLPGYGGLSLPAVPVALLKLPPGVRCDPASAAASFSAKRHTLTVTAPIEKA